MKIYAIIPARSGSTRFKNKNIKKFLGKELFLHSIFFARRLKFISKIILSTDSKKYSNILDKKFEDIFIHKRSRYASSNKAMEEDILLDLKKYFIKNKETPDAILWLRPTHPLRCLKTFERAYKKFKKINKSVVIVHSHDPRLFYEKRQILKPLLSAFKKKSMIRSQGLKPFYSIFSGEFFKFPNKYNKKFLGNSISFEVAPKLTNFDIDTEQDLNKLNNLCNTNKNFFKKFIHKK